MKTYAFEARTPSGLAIARQRATDEPQRTDLAALVTALENGDTLAALDAIYGDNARHSVKS